MTVREMSRKLGLAELVGGGGLDREVAGCYIGDLLSWVMGRAGEDNAWITVMGNINAIAVAKLADLSCIILCERAPLDAEAKAQAEANGIVVLQSETPAYALAVAFSRLEQ